MTERNNAREDPRINVKVALSGLWITMLFVFAYVDIFSFWRSDVVNGALDGEVPGAGFEINQTFLALTTLYILIPSLMVSFCLIAPAKLSRPINLVVSLLYAASVTASAIGETWTYYLIGSVFEVVLLLTIAGFAWFWPRTRDPRAATEVGAGSHEGLLPRSRPAMHR